MKTIILTLLLFTFSFTSCLSDEGRYNYKDIQEIDIADLDEVYTSLFLIDTLKISPKIDFLDMAEADFDFSWRVLSQKYMGAKIDSKIISSQKNLEYRNLLARNDNYTICLDVTNKNTGIVWTKSAKLSVVSQLSKGWVLLGNNSKSKIVADMISIPGKDKEPILVKNIFSQSNLGEIENPISTFYSKVYSNLFLLTKSGTYILDLEDFTTKNNAGIASTIYDNTISGDFYANMIYQNGAQTRIILGESKLYIGAPRMNGYAGSAINKYKDVREIFNIANTIAFDVRRFCSMRGSLIAYNTDENRFVSCSVYSSAEYCENMPDKEGDVFMWKSDNDLVEIINSQYISAKVRRKTVSYAIMRNTNKELLLYSFVPSAKKKLAQYKLNAATDINYAKFITFSKKNTIMYYAVDNKLYAYDFTSKNTKLINTFAKHITMIHCDMVKEKSDVFYVAIYNKSEENSGELFKYEIKQNPNEIEIIELEDCAWKGLNEIINMSWKGSTR